MRNEDEIETAFDVLIGCCKLLSINFIMIKKHLSNRDIGKAIAQIFGTGIGTVTGIIILTELFTPKDIYRITYDSSQDDHYSKSTSKFAGVCVSMIYTLGVLATGTNLGGFSGFGLYKLGLFTAEKVSASSSKFTFKS